MKQTLKRITASVLSLIILLGIVMPTISMPVNAAENPPLEAENEISLSSEGWYTNLVRKLATAGIVSGQTYKYDADNPYVNVNVGLFHNVSIDVDEDTKGIASYYLPDGLNPWAPAAIIMTPDNTTAEKFSNSLIGLAWRQVADKNKVALAFVEPENGGKWNLSLSEDFRDDAKLLDGLYQLMRKKSTKLTGSFSMDKSHTALVGYKEGGAAALLFGARWASDFSSICAVDATTVPSDALASLGKEYVLPFPGDSTKGVQEEAIAAETVDTPVWFINSAANGDNENTLEYFLSANQATVGDSNSVAEYVYISGREGSASEVWVSNKNQSPNTIWNEFSSQFKRFMAMQLPGRVAKAQDFTESGFYNYEETINGETRRWMVYVPSSYTGDESVPLVLVMHGYTASMYAIAEESRWYDVAEENGFIVVFAQGLVRSADLMGNIPTSMWLAGAFSALAGENVDKDVDVKFIDTLLDKMEENYNIDSSRIYATGHSNGALMTWTLGSTLTERFAAIAPVGYMSSKTAEISSEVLIPTWSFLGEYDTAGVPDLIEGNATVTALQSWNEHNRTNESEFIDSTSYDGAFITKTFANDDGIPLVKYTVVGDTPHVYLQEESVSIWNEFFSKYSRGLDGTLYYQNDGEESVAVTCGQYIASGDWYTTK